MAFYNQLHTLDAETALYFYGIYPRSWDEPSPRQVFLDPETREPTEKDIRFASKRNINRGLGALKDGHHAPNPSSKV